MIADVMELLVILVSGDDWSLPKAWIARECRHQGNAKGGVE